MKRRAFIRSASMAGAALAIAPLVQSCASHVGTAALEFDLEEATIVALQEGMYAGKYTSRQLVELYLQRIEAIDRSGPQLNSVIEVNPDALAIADALDRERKQKGVRGPLHGIPVMVKDNIDTADRMHTTAGSLALAGSTAPRDAFLIERLRASGAVLLGKTNLSEWANFRSTHSSSGWSGRGGQTKNPFALVRNPCGSSSGSGAAVSANLCAVAVGTETDGSIVCPSSTCGIVGLKPTVGLISRSGIIPISHSQDTAGPMARTVADAAALLNVLAGIDPRDPATAGSRDRVAPDYTRFLDANGLRGARIGVARNFFGWDARVDDLMARAIEAMKQQGAEIVDPVEIPHKGEYDDSEFEVLLYEFKADLNAYLAGREPEVKARTLKDLIAYNEANREKEMPYFGQEIFLMAEKKGPLTDQAYRDALEKNLRLSRQEGIDAVLAQHKLDAIVTPTGGPAWTTDLVNGDHYGGGSSTAAAVAGYPSITVPAGYIHDLPVGISFTGAAYAEPTLIRVAYAFEQATRHRRPPRFTEGTPGGC